jgi:cell division protein FtsL
VLFKNSVNRKNSFSKKINQIMSKIQNLEEIMRKKWNNLSKLEVTIFKVLIVLVLGLFIFTMGVEAGNTIYKAIN